MISLPFFQPWISSLAMLKPRALASWISCAWQLFVNGLTNLVRTFWWLFIIVTPMSIFCSYYVAMGIKEIPWYVNIASGIADLGTNILIIGYLLFINKKQITKENMISSWLYFICLGIFLGLLYGLLIALPNKIAISSGRLFYLVTCFNFFKSIEIYVLVFFGLIQIFSFYYWINSTTFPHIFVLNPFKKGIAMVMHFLPILVIIFAAIFGYNSLKISFFPSSILPTTVFLVIGDFIKFCALLFGWSMAYVYYLQKKIDAPN